MELFKELIIRYQNLLYSIGMRFFRNVHESEDFVQDVLIKAYENLKSYRGRGSFRAWLTRIAYNLGIDRTRARTVEDDISGREIPVPALTPEEGHIRSEVSDVLRGAINRLPEKYRICLDFFFFWGLSYNEISDITGFPVNTIKSHVLRAKQALRDCLRGTVAERYYEVR
ncbi:MAG: sigma-70 family RNA polymerase sigma factor [Spirochaetes bacterium]|nr:sigma-70 family RNA polymerase sigma factor [Spirochaetota bacterium]